MNNIFPYLGGLISIGGLIFQAGKQSEKLNILDNKVHAQEITNNDLNKTVYDIHGKVCSIEVEIKEIKKIHQRNINPPIINDSTELAIAYCSFCFCSSFSSFLVFFFSFSFFKVKVLLLCDLSKSLILFSNNISSLLFLESLYLILLFLSLILPFLH